MKPEDFDIQKLVEDLQGTCNNLSDALPEGMEEDDLTEDDHDYIDNEIFLCDECGWWCESSEANENEDCAGLCADCGA